MAADLLGSQQMLQGTGPSETSVTSYRIKMRHNKDHIRSERVTHAASDLVKSSQVSTNETLSHRKINDIKSKLNSRSPVRYETCDSQ